MTAIARLTRAELRKLATTPAFLITLATAVALAVISVVANAANAGRSGAAALGTDAATYQMLKVGPVIFVAMLVLGIIATGGEYRHRTIISAMLITPRRGAQIAAKAIAIAVAGVVLSGLTFGLGLAAAAGELHARGIDQLPAGTAGMFAGSVAAAVLFGLIGVALGYITRSTLAAVVGAVGWVVFAEYAIVRTVAPRLFNWLIGGTATVLTGPPMPGSIAPTPSPPPLSSPATPRCCSPSPPRSRGGEMWPDPPCPSAAAPRTGRRRDGIGPARTLSTTAMATCPGTGVPAVSQPRA